MDLFGSYWPSWAGALALGVMTVGYWLVFRRSFGVSGMWGRSVSGDGATVTLDDYDPAVVEAALLAATVAQFGPAAAATVGALPAIPVIGPVMEATPTRRWTPDATFLVALVLGGALSALASGHWALRFNFGDVYTRLFGGGLRTAAAALAGGILVGFGTRMAGGCTSGHGLTGCASLQKASFLATAGIFAGGVALSILLDRVAR